MSRQRMVVLFLVSGLLVLSNLGFELMSNSQHIPKASVQKELQNLCLSTSSKNSGGERFSIEFLQTQKVLYSNFFQTAGGNRGIRIEISPENEVSVIVGSPTNQIKSGFTLTGLHAGLNQIELWVGYKTVMARLNNGPRLQTRIETTPMCDDIQLGHGYNSARTFKGLVEMYRN